jgi:uncharacterized protein (DUF885 family)
MSMKKLLSLLAASLLATAALADDVADQRQAIFDRETAVFENKDDLSETERLNTLIDMYFEYAMLEFPEFATFIGLPQGQDRWSDGSVEAVKRRQDENARSLEVLQSIDRNELEGTDRTNYDLLLEQVVQAEEQRRFPVNQMQLTQLNGVQQDISQMFSVMPATNVEQYENLLSRLRGVPKQINDAGEWMQLGLEAGVTPPQITLRDVPQQVINQIPESPEESPLLRAFYAMPDTIPADEQERLRQEAEELYTRAVRPAYQGLHEFLVEQYIPGARESIAMSEMPDGKAWYAFNVKQMTTTDMQPDDIHQLGLSEVKRIRTEMDRVIEESGFEGSFEEFTEFLRTDPQFYFTESEDLLESYRDISKQADPELMKLFGILPRQTYGVIEVPEYAEQSQTTAYYLPGSNDAGRPGWFYANTYALDTRPKWEMEALTLHEAVPGHHLQLAIQQEIEELPWFRRFGWGYTGFVEGWGLYAESLGEEMGFYTDPYSKFGQLTYEMWRAIRLVVDTGMHSRGWTRQEAIDFFVKNTGKSQHDIVVEIDRYIVWPGQALAYKIGELKIKELRARAEKELGENFDIRSFHDIVLGSGARPLTVLENDINEWIASQKS